MANSGISIPIKTIVSNLASISFGEFACPVLIDPSCPVFMACNISNASGPLTSPTITRSGRMRKDVLIKSLMLISVVPSSVELLVSKLIKFFIFLSCNSAESSIVITLSSSSTKFERAFRNVVFPDPVPPLTKILYPALTKVLKKSAASFVIDFHLISLSMSIVSLGNFRIVTTAPDKEIGGNTTFTLEPSSSLVSTIGFAWFTLLFVFPTICCITSLSLVGDE